VSTDYFPPIQRAVQNLSPNTLEARRALYDKARAALLKQLKGADPALTDSQITKERLLLEDAIRRIETDMLRPETAARLLGEQRTAPQLPQARGFEPPQPAMAESEATPRQSSFADDYDDQDELYTEPVAREAAAPDPRRTDRQRPPAPRPASGARISMRRFALIGIAALAVLGGAAAAVMLLPTPQEQAELRPVASAPAVEEPARPTSSGKLTDRLGETPATGTADPSPAPAAPPPPAAEPVEEPDQAPPAPAAPAQQQAALPQPAPSSTAAQPLSPAPRGGAVVAQQAVLFEEQPDSPQRGQAFQGTVTWRTESVSTSNNAPLETAIRGEVEIPERKMRANVTIRKNADPALPASHTLEIQFVIPNDFPNGGIANVPGVLMKQAAQQRGAPLQGLSVKVTSGFFLVGLSDAPTDPGRNEQLLREREWIDVPILYENGRRAILTLEKGVPGGQVFADAFAAWGSASSVQQ
jgi:hypothetical protein